MKKLSYLLERLSYTCSGGQPDIEIKDVVYDSRKVSEGSLFVCIKGTVSDGHTYVSEVVEKGAAVLVVQEKVTVPEGVVVIEVTDTRYALALIAAAYFDYPAEKIKMIGITGTKGKTTTTYMIKSILENAGIRTGLIGTIEVIFAEERIAAGNTTPESYLVQEYLSRMVAEGLDCAVMEVSSQGLMLHRTAGIVFDIGIFTNIEPDHIGPGEHTDFEQYLDCKRLLFKQCRIGIINRDDHHFDQIIQGHTCDIETYGFADDCDYQASHVRLTQGPGFLGVSYQVSGKINSVIELNLPGKFSVYNSLAAVAVCRCFEVADKVMTGALKAASVKGRIEMVQVSEDFTLMIDYAHNAMSLESLLKTLKEYQPARLVCLFGCGGNRSKYRRYEMGEVSGRYADLTVITSDNPRNEKPMDIIADIKIGIGKTDGAYVEIPDRKEAIAYVIENGRKGDVIILAGKGHEDYQEIKGVKYPMDERVIIAEILEERKKR